MFKRCSLQNLTIDQCVETYLPAYVDLGDEVALDEASVASRSRYGQDVIFLNKTKPGGKYHFRFYMICCSTSYICIRLKMHTKNSSDVADPEPTNLFTPADLNTTPSVSKANPKSTGLEDNTRSNNSESCITNLEDSGEITKNPTKRMKLEK